MFIDLSTFNRATGNHRVAHAIKVVFMSILLTQYSQVLAGGTFFFRICGFHNVEKWVTINSSLPDLHAFMKLIYVVCELHGKSQS